jgi:16S rRNA (guanine1207-N2)-methyltransferase
VGLVVGLVRRAIRVAVNTPETLLQTPFGGYRLNRQPVRKRELLRAWDAADEYLLNWLGEQGGIEPQTRLLIMNDAFGALAVALHESCVWSVSDSVLAQTAVQKNYAQNGLSADRLNLLTSLEMPGEKPDLVLIKVPKTLALLEYQLLQLRPLLTPDTRIIVAGMVKNMSARLWNMLEKLIGTTTTSLTKKKAKLIQVEFDPGLPVPDNPYPVTYTLENTNCQIINHANVFSREKLDIGTRFFLAHLPRSPQAREIIDLGCGNGVLALMALRLNPEAHVHCVDESYMAVASAQATLQGAFGKDAPASFHAAADLSGFSSASVDLVLCNPPFHQQHVVGDQIAQGMFKDAARVLRKGGELWVVGNRHLGYHKSLKRLFGNVELVASNSKFVILRSVRTQGNGNNSA